MTAAAPTGALAPSASRILHLDKVGKSFGRQRVLSDFDLEIDQGAFLTLLGPSGCGKSTTLNLIAGFLQPDDGRIMLRGTLANRLPPQRRRLGMVFQSWALFPHMTVFDNVAYGLRAAAVPAADVAPRVEAMLRLVRLPDAAGKFPSQLSGGMQQRVALARALVTEPDLLLLDEPLSNLDAALRREMQVEIKRIHEQLRVTTLLVTHSQEEALVMSDTIAVMRAGRIEQLAPPFEIYNRPRTRFVCTFLGDANVLEGTVAEAGAGRAIVRAGSLALAVADPEGRLSAGDPAQLGLRPESVTVRDDPPSTSAGGGDAVNRIPATVTDVIFMGSNITYYLEATGPEGDRHALVAFGLASAARRVFERGSTVAVDLPAESFMILEEDDL